MADMFGVQFYPTPGWLADEMMRKVDWSNVTFILEPSAGKGDLVEAFKRAEKDKRKPREVECYEIDPNLVSVLKGKGYNAYNGDFLEYDPLTRYDLIMMNPPFRNGDGHLLHALDLLKHGGQCV
jgi:phospholipid N-methyltransferase